MREKLLQLRKKMDEVEKDEKRVLNRSEFSFILAAVHCILVGTKPLGLELAEDIDLDQLKKNLKETTGVVDKESAISYLTKMRNYGCGRKYVDFLSFWEGKPSFDVEDLNEQQRQNFEQLMAFAKQFYDVVGKHGFVAWDIGESIQLVRKAYMCGYLEEALAYEIINDFSNIALSQYTNWKDYAISYICGGCFFMYENSRNNEYVQKMFDQLYKAVSALFFEEGQRIWSEFHWYHPKNYFKGLKVKENLIDKEANAACFVTDRISMDGCKIGYMERQLPNPQFKDSGWKFFAGDETQEYLGNSFNVGVFGLDVIASYDEDILPLLDSEIGTIYIRNEEGKFVKKEREV